MSGRGDRARLLAFAAGASLAVGSASPAAGQFVSGTYADAIGSRQYRLYVPSGYDRSRPHTLVVMLHGCTQDAEDLARGTRMNEAAEAERFLVLYPEQPAAANAKKCWNWYDAAHQRRDAGEPAMIAGMTAQIVRDYSVDPDRVHLAGISAGAAMASILAVAYPERYASLALHSGIPYGAATDVMAALGAMARGASDPDALGAAAFTTMGSRARAIPVLVIHGGSDAVVKPVNGEHAARQWSVTDARALGIPALAADAVMTGETGGYAWSRECWRDAASGCMVESLLVKELGHAWSGGSKSGTFTDELGPNATAEIVRFFREHPLRHVAAARP